MYRSMIKLLKAIVDRIPDVLSDVDVYRDVGNTSEVLKVNERFDLVQRLADVFPRPQAVCHSGPNHNVYLMRRHCPSL